VSPLLHACARALPRRALALHVGAVGVLLAVTWTGLDADRPAVAVLRGVALVLAAALALAVDEPEAALLDAAPTALRRRLAVRLAVCGAVAAPVWAGALAVVGARGTAVPVRGLTLELLALVALGLAVPAALRRWWRVAEPALVAGPVLLGTVLAAAQLPRDVRLLVSTPLDPAWTAAHVRWSVLLLAGLALLAVAVTDPAGGPRPSAAAWSVVAVRVRSRARPLLQPPPTVPRADAQPVAVDRGVHDLVDVDPEAVGGVVGRDLHRPSGHLGLARPAALIALRRVDRR
jgi:hypothetical protein